MRARPESQTKATESQLMPSCLRAVRSPISVFLYSAFRRFHRCHTMTLHEITVLAKRTHLKPMHEKRKCECVRENRSRLGQVANRLNMLRPSRDPPLTGEHGHQRHHEPDAAEAEALLEIEFRSDHAAGNQFDADVGARRLSIRNKFSEATVG